jgi:hypothetical protein
MGEGGALATAHDLKAEVSGVPFGERNGVRHLPGDVFDLHRTYFDLDRPLEKTGGLNREAGEKGGRKQLRFADDGGGSIESPDQRVDFELAGIGIDDPHFGDTGASVDAAFFVSIPGRGGGRDDFDDQIGSAFCAFVDQDVTIFVGHIIEVGLKDVDVIEEDVGKGDDHFAQRMTLEIRFDEVKESTDDFLMIEVGGRRHDKIALD